MKNELHSRLLAKAPDFRYTTIFIIQPSSTLTMLTD